MAATAVYDMHCHLHEYDNKEVEAILESLPNLTIVAVSEDTESLQKTLELASTFKGRIIPCAGLHPWSIMEAGEAVAEELARAAYRMDLNCIGEVGLDRKFLPPETWEAQVRVARLFLRLAAELDAYVTLHSPGAWRPLLSLLLEEGVEKAMFHWYTGPLDLIGQIVAFGYKISINPAIRIQEKHRRVAVEAPLEAIVFESDGPYNYRGLRLDPRMIPEAQEIVARLKGVGVDVVAEAARTNSEKLLH